MSDDAKPSTKESLTAAAKLMQSLAKPTIAVVSAALPVLIQFSATAYGFFKKLPKNVAQFLIGLVFCFFGGLYPTLFAAVQAAKESGVRTVAKAMEDLSEEAMIIIEESKKDDARDDDKDGKADVAQLEGKDLMARKFKLIMTKMNPKKVDNAIGAIYTVWLAVAAVLAIQFARTIAMALAISDFLKKPMNRFVAPTVKLATPKEYQKWVPVVLGWYVTRCLVDVIGLSQLHVLVWLIVLDVVLVWQDSEKCGHGDCVAYSSRHFRIHLCPHWRSYDGKGRIQVLGCSRYQTWWPNPG